MQTETSEINIKEIIDTDPIDLYLMHYTILRSLVIVGLFSLFLMFLSCPPAVAWGVYYSNVIFWMGLSAGGVALTAIFEMVGAKWAIPLRRISEAHISTFFFSYVLFLMSYFGRKHIFIWAAKREISMGVWWMQIDVMYLRHALLLGLLFIVMWRFVRPSLRGDVGLIRESAEPKSMWFISSYNFLVRNWKGSAHEIPRIKRKLAITAPLVILVYAIVFSFFAFEMVMSLDGLWHPNLMGVFISVSSVYAGLIMTVLLVLYFCAISPAYRKCVSTQQFWNMGKLIFALCVLWGYLVFSQFLPQWYSGVSEEVQWLVLRIRERPWRLFAWIVFGMSFVIPLFLLLSRDLKRTPRMLAAAIVIPFVGVWLEMYILIMPAMSPESLPFGMLDILLFLGFLGLYLLCVINFMRRYPYLAILSIYPNRRGGY